MLKSTQPSTSLTSPSELNFPKFVRNVGLATLAFILCVAGIIILLIATLTTLRKAIATPSPQTPKNFIVISKEATGSACCEPYIMIVKDSQTEQEYIIVEDNNGVSITPRLKKKEE